METLKETLKETYNMSLLAQASVARCAQRPRRCWSAAAVTQRFALCVAVGVGCSRHPRLSARWWQTPRRCWCAACRCAMSPLVLVALTTRGPTAGRCNDVRGVAVLLPCTDRSAAYTHVRTHRSAAVRGCSPAQAVAPRALRSGGTAGPAVTPPEPHLWDALQVHPHEHCCYP